MGVLTKIQWCHHTWNPWRGCAKVSPGCANCYAERDSKRNPRVLGTWGPNGRRSLGAESYWSLPYRWNSAAAAARERRRVFTLSLGDWLEDRPDLVGPRARLLTTIQATPMLDWLLLTKRPQNWRRALEEALDTEELAGERLGPARSMVEHWLTYRPPGNVWSGVSVEDQARAEERYEPAIAIPAFIRFFSCEPLLSPIWFPSLRGIDWVIVGGESGAEDKVRPLDLDWIDGIIQQCRAYGIAPFVKQLGAWIEATDVDSICPADVFPWEVRRSQGRLGPFKARLHLKDPKGGDPDEWPEDLRVREFPR